MFWKDDPSYVMDGPKYGMDDPNYGMDGPNYDSSIFLLRFSVLRLLGGSAASQPQRRKSQQKYLADGNQS